MSHVCYERTVFLSLPIIEAKWYLTVIFFFFLLLKAVLFSFGPREFQGGFKGALWLQKGASGRSQAPEGLLRGPWAPEAPSGA